MLERASSSAECTAHQILRRLELPTRSRRTLDPGFWRHGGDQLNVPVWWPIYLNDVRRKAQTYSTFPEAVGANGLSSVKAGTELEHGSLRTPQLSRHRQTAAVNNKTRSFTRSAVQSQHLSTADTELENPLGGRDYTETNVIRDGKVLEEMGPASFQPYNAKIPKQPHHSPHDTTKSVFLSLQKEDVTTLPTRNFPTASSKPDYARAWALFAESEYKTDSASRLLHFLARSDERLDLRRALSALDFIPQRLRSQEDYETAVQVATQLHNYRSATIIIREAVSKQMGDNLFFKFIAYCVSNTLWSTLAIFWDTIRGSGDDRRQLLLRAKSTENGIAKTPNFAGRYSFHFDGIEDLPGKIVVLADRLARSDAVLAAQKESLIEVCKRLAYTAVDSQKVMSVITAEGAIALFDVQQKLQFNSKLHLAAIGTINGMQNRGSKSHLALLIYRNHRFVSCDAAIPKWVYGALLAICSDGRQRPEVYHFILEEFAKMHGRPDDLAFRTAISACAAQAEASALFRIFKDFCRVSGPKTLHDLNPLIHVYAVTGDVENARLQFNRIQDEFGFSPDVVSWTSLILAHARSQNNETAFDAYEDMKKADVRPNAYTWAVLMSVASRRGDIDQAQALYEEAKEDKVPDSSYMLGALVESLLLNDDFQKAEALVLRATRLLSAESPIRLWNSLFRYCAFKADNKAILRLQQLMNLSNVQADGMTYAALMTSLVVQGKTSDAARILRTLRFSRDLDLTEFHYSILIHGFAMEGNRDMAMMLYHEMTGRFSHATPSARLAMLHTQIQRDSDSTKPQPKSRLQQSRRERQAVAQQTTWHALDFLANSLLEQTSTEVSSKNPNPGFGRLLAREGIESTYFETLIEFLQSRGAYDLAEQIMTQSSKLTPSSGTSTSIRSLNLQMQSATHKRQWAQVEDIWNSIVSVSVTLGSPPRRDQPQVTQETPQPPSATPGLQGIDIPSYDQLTFKTMIPTIAHNAPGNESASGNEPEILPARRFMLSRPLSLYMQSLDYQSRHSDIIEVVQRTVSRGFALSSMNWNRYVQVLSKSSEWEHRLAAFVAFENYLLPNMPPWRLLRRGKWISPTAISTDVVKTRKQLDKLDPSIPRPTYFTMIHLSTALIRAHRSASLGNTNELDSLQQKAPGTIYKVQRTPHVRDRIQGLLLRGRQIIGDPPSRPRALSHTMDRSGIVGSRSPLDHLSPEIAKNIEDTIVPKDNIRTLLQRQRRQDDKIEDTMSMTVRQRLGRHLERVEQGEDKISGQALFIPSLNRFETRKEAKLRYLNERYIKLQPLIELGEQINGEVIRGSVFLAAKGRMETDRERENRVEKDILERLDAVEQVRKDVSARRLVRSAYRGEPLLGPSLLSDMSTIPSPFRTKALAEVILYGDREKLLQGDSKTHPVTDIPPFQPYSVAKRGDPPETISMREWASTDSHPAVDTRTLIRQISPRYVPRDKNSPVRYTTANERRAWSINKARRRTRLKENQSFVRWNKQAQVAEEERSRKMEAEYEAAKARELEKKDDSNRVARLAMSRGARR